MKKLVSIAVLSIVCTTLEKPIFAQENKSNLSWQSCFNYFTSWRKTEGNNPKPWYQKYESFQNQLQDLSNNVNILTNSLKRRTLLMATALTSDLWFLKQEKSYTSSEITEKSITLPNGSGPKKYSPLEIAIKKEALICDSKPSEACLKATETTTELDRLAHINEPFYILKPENESLFELLKRRTIWTHEMDKKKI